MKILIDHIKDIYEPQEINEVLLMVYNIINFAIRDEADSLEFSPTRIVWIKNNEIKGKMDIDGLRPTVDFLETFKMVLIRDRTVQNVFTKTLSTNEEVAFRVLVNTKNES
jgi:hypothetical protein